MRWMQFSIFQSITRVHGDRNPKGSKYTGAPLSTQCDPTGASGGPVEPWAYGPAGVDALNLTRQALALKESLKPYLMAQLDQLSEHGQPLMRSLWFDFPDDKAAMEVPDASMMKPRARVTAGGSKPALALKTKAVAHEPQMATRSWHT